MSKVTIHNFKGKTRGNMLLLDLTDAQKQQIIEGKMIEDVEVHLELENLVIDIDRELAKGGDNDGKPFN